MRARGETASCAWEDRLLVTPDGANLYRFGELQVGEGRISVYTLEDGGIAHVRTHRIPSSALTLSQDGGFLFGTDSFGSLQTYLRDPATGDIELGESVQVSSSPLEAVASPDGVLHVLFGDFDVREPRVAVYALDDPGAPRLIGMTPPFLADSWHDWWVSGACAWVGPRPGVPIGDAVCSGLVFTFEWDAESGELRVTDYVNRSHADRYNTPLPPYREVVAVAAGDGGRRIYVATKHFGIIVFQRIGESEEPET